MNVCAGAVALAWIFRSFGAAALTALAANPSIPLLMAFVAVLSASIAAHAWRWHMLLSGLRPSIGLVPLALYRSAGHAVAVLIPSGKVGGDPLRAWLAARARVAPGDAIASVAVDRTLELGATAPFSILFATVLVQSGVPQLAHALVTITVASSGLAAGVAIAARRLRGGKGIVTSLARNVRLDRLQLVHKRLEVIEESEAAMARLVNQPQRTLIAFVVGLGTNLIVVAEHALLLTALDLPHSPTAVVAAIFATGAATMLPVPAGLGVLEGAHIWLFGMLGYPADVGLAVGLASRLRDLLWMLPGLLYLLGRSLRSSFARVREV